MIVPLLNHHTPDNSYYNVHKAHMRPKLQYSNITSRKITKFKATLCLEFTKR